MELAIADVDHSTGVRILTSLERRCRPLIGGAGQNYKHDDRGGPQQRATDASRSHRSRPRVGLG